MTFVKIFIINVPRDLNSITNIDFDGLKSHEQSVMRYWKENLRRFRKRILDADCINYF